MTMVARLLLLLTALAALASPACAPTRPYNPDGLPPAQMSRIGEVCDRVMGLPPGLDTHYQGCQESLSRSLAARRGPTR